MAKKTKSIKKQKPVIVTKPLSPAEKAWILSVWGKKGVNIDSVCTQVPDADINEVKGFIEDSFPLVNFDDDKTRGKTAELFARDQERGIVTMTQAASEMADARAAHRIPSVDKMARQKKDTIFIIDEKKKVR